MSMDLEGGGRPPSPYQYQGIQEWQPRRLVLSAFASWLVQWLCAKSKRWTDLRLVDLSSGAGGGLVV